MLYLFRRASFKGTICIITVLKACCRPLINAEPMCALTTTLFLLQQVLCHCLLCRKLTGSSFLTGFTLSDPGQSSPTSTNGHSEATAPKATFEWQSKSNSSLKVSTGLQESSLTMTFYGCSKCPSTLYKTCKEGFPGIMILLAGSLDARIDVDGKSGEGDVFTETFKTPQVEFWVQHRVLWVREVEGAKQCQTFT